MRRLTRLLILASIAVPVATLADVRGPEGDRGFRYVYPANSSPAQAAKLHHDDLKQLAAEGAKLAVGDGGTLTDDHRAYLDTRRAMVEERYAEALGQTASNAP